MTKNRNLYWQLLNIPFKEKFVHHSADRKTSETVIVQISNQDGLSGFGESCPRIYVTNEDFKTVEGFLLRFKKPIELILTLEELTIFMKNFESDIDQNPAAWCAVELAVLDLLAKEKKISVEELLGIKKDSHDISYTAVIGIDSYLNFFWKALKYRVYGFSDFKIKLSGNIKQDKNSLLMLAFLGVGKNHIRVDGNNLWPNEESALFHLRSIEQFIWAIEEPLQLNEFSAMARIANKLGIKIILDESFLNLSSLRNIKNQENIFIPNLRISKLGGVLRTLQLVRELQKKNFQWILGSHVGEMSLLTRASLLIQQAQSKTLLIAKEGAFSTHLLTEDLFYPNLKFSRGAKIKFLCSQEEFFLKTGWNINYRYNNKEKI